MKSIKKAFPLFLLVLLLFLVYRPFFSTGIFVATDFPLGFKETRVFSPFWSISWDFMAENGLGGFGFKTFWIDLYTNLTYTVSQSLNLSWWFSQRIFWIVPFVALALFSPYYLSGLFFKEPTFRLLTVLLYSFNTYILMVVAGGQFGVAFAYALSPLTLAVFLKSSRLLAGLSLGLNIIFDPRIGLLVLAVVIFYSIFTFKFKKLFSFIAIPIVIALLLNSYWLLPLIFHRDFVLAEEYTGGSIVQFLSFAKFENSLSLLHPNWPENIFGKTYFMRWEFLILPIIAYGALLFTCLTRIDTNKKRINANILFFALLGLIGAFLAKGSNPPFGEIYAWLFRYFPGMIMFRDSTKFYVLVALSYSVLVPLSITNTYRWINEKLKIKNEKQQFKVQKFLPNLFFLFTIFYLLFLIRPAWLGELGGIFKPRQVPQEYVILKDFLASQPEFFRTLWVPKNSRFGFYSNNHPFLNAQEIFRTSEVSVLVEKIKEEDTREFLKQAGVKYIILPYDTEGEIFLKDRKYDQEQRLSLEEELDKIPWLKKITSFWFNDIKHFSKITVYQTADFYDHFWLEDATALHSTVAWRMINPTKYIVQIKNLAKPASLVFSETYNSGWQAKIEGETISSKPFNELLSSKLDGIFAESSFSCLLHPWSKLHGFRKRVNKVFNSFLIKKTGDFEVVVEFAPQKYVNYGLIISILTLALSIVIFKNTLRKKHMFNQ